MAKENTIAPTVAPTPGIGVVAREIILRVLLKSLSSVINVWMSLMTPSAPKAFETFAPFVLTDLDKFSETSLIFTPRSLIFLQKYQLA